MSFEDFRELIKTMVEERLGNQFRVTVSKVIKNNGVELHGITIGDKDVNIAPTIYLGDYYSDYLNNRDLGDIVDEILKIYDENKFEKSVEIEWFKDFDLIEPKVIFRLVNTSKNLDLLQNIPSIPYLDLSIIFRVVLEDNAVIDVNNEHLKIWDVSVDELFQAAKRNMPKLYPAEIVTMNEMLVRLNAPLCGEEIPELPILVLSNTESLYGASTLLYADILTQFNTDLFIIPSSVHECILLPAKSGDEADDIRQLIGEVNETLEPTQVLSDNLYFYSCKRNEITII